MACAKKTVFYRVYASGATLGSYELDEKLREWVVLGFPSMDSMKIYLKKPFNDYLWKTGIRQNANIK